MLAAAVVVPQASMPVPKNTGHILGLCLLRLLDISGRLRKAVAADLPDVRTGGRPHVRLLELHHEAPQYLRALGGIAGVLVAVGRVLQTEEAGGGGRYTRGGERGVGSEGRGIGSVEGEAAWLVAMGRVLQAGVWGQGGISCGELFHHFLPPRLQHKAVVAQRSLARMRTPP